MAPENFPRTRKSGRDSWTLAWNASSLASHCHASSAPSLKPGRKSALRATMASPTPAVANGRDPRSVPVGTRVPAARKYSPAAPKNHGWKCESTVGLKFPHAAHSLSQQKGSSRIRAMPCAAARERVRRRRSGAEAGARAKTTSPASTSPTCKRLPGHNRRFPAKAQPNARVAPRGNAAFASRLRSSTIAAAMSPVVASATAA